MTMVADPSPVTTGYLGCIGFFFGVLALNKFGARFNQERAVESLFLLGCALLPMLVHDGPWLRHPESIAQLTALTTDAATAALAHTGIKLVGMLASVGGLAFFYWLFEEYHASFMSGIFGVDERINPPENTVPYYHNYFRAFRVVYDFLHPAGFLTLVFTCVFLSELIVADHDGFHALGSALLSPFAALLNASFGLSLPLGGADIDAQRLVQHALSCTVQFFYCPLMFGYLCENLAELHFKGFAVEGRFQYMLFWRYANNIIFSVDVCFAAIGYFFNVSFFDNQIRSVEPTVLGWVSALACYQPFFHLLTASYIDYTRNPPWNEWIQQQQQQQQPQQTGGSNSNGSSPSDPPASSSRKREIVLRVYGTVVLVFQAIFAWCTVSFGLRYSNLTYRGLVTSGPYYFSKHPAYIVKIIAFALISVPWVDLRRNAGLGRSIRNLATLAILAWLYYVRALTEETHLAAVSPDYQAYADQIALRHSTWFSW